jgi:hypothetical protein
MRIMKVGKAALMREGDPMVVIVTKSTHAGDQGIAKCVPYSGQITEVKGDYVTFVFEAGRLIYSRSTNTEVPDPVYDIRGCIVEEEYVRRVNEYHGKKVVELTSHFQTQLTELNYELSEMLSELSK